MNSSITSLPTRRPSAGYAVTFTVEAASAVALAELAGVIAAAGGDLTSLVPDGAGRRRLTVACATDEHQRSITHLVQEAPGVRVLAVRDETFALHEGGKIAVVPTAPVTDPAMLAQAYTPGVGRVSQAIADDPALVWSHTGRSNAVAVLSDGSAVLGLGDIGPEAAMPVMEGKAVLFKQFGGVDAYPVCVRARTADEIVAVARALAPTFGGINLEDIAAPVCFEVEDRLRAELDIPVFHDDQHGTAIVTLAALENAARVVGKPLASLQVAIVGTGAAGIACAKLLHSAGVTAIVGVDRQGILHRGRTDLERLPASKRWMVDHANPDGRTGGCHEALKGADVLLGLSGPGVIEAAWLADLADDAIVFALANPVPEVLPEEMPRNVAVVATGRSDYPNQINNVLAFPGVFRGLLDARATTVTESMKTAAAAAIAELVPDPTPTFVIPGAFDPRVAPAVAEAVRACAIREGVTRRR
jgi:malate dehydrogenase (oxaloacetate-decarboxylating)